MRFFLLLSIVLLVGCNKPSPPPNIVLIFTDDQGYGDLSAYGSETINTPNIDALAESGLKLLDFHVSSSVCSPSRASLLTGCYPLRVGIPKVLFPNGDWGSKPNVGLNPNEVTIAEMLKEKGYATAMAGKWHLGHRPKFLPTNQGFDQYLGIPFSNDMTVVPSMKLAEDIRFLEGWTEADVMTINDKPWEDRRSNPPLIRNTEVIEVPANQITLTQRYTESSVAFINDNANQNPFFLYLAHSMPHVPIYASDEFKGRSKGGLYGDVIEEIDGSLGDIIATLKANGILENTLVIFASDNGPWLSYGNHGGSAGALKGGKFGIWEGGFRVPAIMSMPGTIPRRSINEQVVTTMDILPTIAEMVNAPLPQHKIDGQSILPLLKGQPMPALDERYFYYYKDTSLLAVRKGMWKYVEAHNGAEVIEPGKDGENGETDYQVAIPESLYDLENDIDESENLITQYPEIAVALKDAGQVFERLLQEERRPIGIDETYNKPIPE